MESLLDVDLLPEARSGPAASPQDVLDLLRTNGGRVTRSRRVLLDVLFEASRHLNAEEIAEAVARVEPAVNMSTVYRNLEELQHLGVVVHTHLGHGPATYRLAASAHPHLYCESCGGIFHLPPAVFDELVDVASREHGFTVDANHFAIPGRCAGCVAGTGVDESAGNQSGTGRNIFP